MNRASVGLLLPSVGPITGEKARFIPEKFPFTRKERNRMKNRPELILDFCGKDKIRNPTEEQVRTALDKLDVDENEGFAILGRNESTPYFIQVNGDRNVGFYLEYNDGSVKDRMFYATDKQLSLEEVTVAFLSYHRGDDKWRTQFEYKKLSTGCLPLLATIGIGVWGVAGAFL